MSVIADCLNALFEVLNTHVCIQVSFSFEYPVT